MEGDTLAPQIQPNVVEQEYPSSESMSSDNSNSSAPNPGMVALPSVTRFVREIQELYQRAATVNGYDLLAVPMVVVFLDQSGISTDRIWVDPLMILLNMSDPMIFGLLRWLPNEELRMVPIASSLLERLVNMGRSELLDWCDWFNTPSRVVLRLTEYIHVRPLMVHTKSCTISQCI